MVSYALAPTNPMNKAMMSCLVSEVIVFGLAFPGMIMVSEIPLWQALAACVLGAVLAIVAAARLRTPLGYLAGWLTQVVGLAMGFLTPMMFAVGALYLGIWAVSFGLGKRIEADLAAR